jgi:hypothetical protein
MAHRVACHDEAPLLQSGGKPTCPPVLRLAVPVAIGAAPVSG